MTLTEALRNSSDLRIEKGQSPYLGLGFSFKYPGLRKEFQSLEPLRNLKSSLEGQKAIFSPFALMEPEYSLYLQIRISRCPFLQNREAFEKLSKEQELSQNLSVKIPSNTSKSAMSTLR